MRRKVGSKLQCSSCGALEGHYFLCAAADLDWKAANYDRVVEGLIEQIARWKRAAARNGGLIAFWQGKFTMVKVENNALRRQIRQAKAGRDLEPKAK